MSGPSARTRLGQSTGGEPGTMHKRQRAGIKHIQRGTTHRACGEGCWVSSGARLGLQERRGIRTYSGPLWRGSRRSGYQRPRLPSQAGDRGWLGPWLCRGRLASLFSRRSRSPTPSESTYFLNRSPSSYGTGAVHDATAGCAATEPPRPRATRPRVGVFVARGAPDAALRTTASSSFKRGKHARRLAAPQPSRPPRPGPCDRVRGHRRQRGGGRAVSAPLCHSWRGVPGLTFPRAVPVARFGVHLPHRTSAQRGYRRRRAPRIPRPIQAHSGQRGRRYRVLLLHSDHGVLGRVQAARRARSTPWQQ